MARSEDATTVRALLGLCPDFAFELAGKSYVTVRGFSLFASTIRTDATSAFDTLEGLDAKYVSHFVTVKDLYMAHRYDSGIILAGHDLVLKKSVIAFSAGNGVGVSGTHNTVEGCLPGVTCPGVTRTRPRTRLAVADPVLRSGLSDERI